MDSIVGQPSPTAADLAGAQNPGGELAALQVDADDNLLVNVAAGTITADNPSVGPTGAAVPADATFVAGTDAGTLRGVHVDSSGDVQVDVLSSVLPSGAATSAKQDAQTALLTTIDADTGNISTNSDSIAANTDAIATDTSVLATVVGIVGNAVPVRAEVVGGSDGTNTRILKTDSSGELQVDVLTLPSNHSVNLAQVAATTTSTGNGTADAGCQRVTIASNNTAFTVNAAQSGTWTVQPGNTANTTAWLVTQQGAATSTLTNVNDTNSSTTLLASNANRKGAMIYNDSTVDLYVKFGATASTTSFTVKIGAQGYYELPANPCIYTGVVDGIWASDASGAARMTEMT